MLHIYKFVICSPVENRTTYCIVYASRFKRAVIALGRSQGATMGALPYAASGEARDIWQAWPASRSLLTML
jgi:uncharacterized cysteine cluster protein YcgN (CxxCxxCC family)